jgi:WD40 repeat protein
MSTRVKPHDLLLLDPGAAELAAAVEGAFRESGLQQAGQASWQPVLDQIATGSEGCRQYESPPGRGPGYVFVAWWTDYQQRKHIRLAVGSFDFYGERHRGRPGEDLRPPVWHVHPERIFRVTRQGQDPTWLASCACGVTAEPRALAWMGSCCGPCHDRAEEGLPPADETAPALFSLPQTIHAVKFAPDGRRLAISSSMRQVRLFSLDGKKERLVYGGDDADDEEEFRPLAFAHDGRFLAAGDPKEEVIRVWRLEAEDREEEQELIFHDTAVDDPVVGLAFSPTEHLLVACTRGGLLGACRRQGDAWEWAHRSRRGEVTAVAFAPGGESLILGHQRCFVSLVNVATWKHRRHFQTGGLPGEDALFVHSYPAADRLALLTACQAHRQGFNSHPTLRLRDLSRRHSETSTYYPAATRLVAASRCGRYLAWVIPETERAHAGIAVWDLQSRERVGRLQWDTEEELADLDFSPNGQTLVTGSVSGTIQFWPWRLLLGL